MGTPDFAATILRSLVMWEGCRLAAVYTQPDRPAGRGYALKAPPVKDLAVAEGIPVRQPPHFKAEAVLAELRRFAPDYLVVAAYGLILPQHVLDIPRRAAINAHASLLPFLRGAAPIHRAIMNGLETTGVSIMRMEAGLDTGPVLLQRAIAISPAETAGSLHDVLASLAAPAVVAAIEGLEAKMLTPVPQDDSRATYAPKLTKADGLLEFSQPLARIDAHVRGVTPWPGAYTRLVRGNKEMLPVGIGAGRMLSALDAAVPAGTILGIRDDCLAVACADGVYGIHTLRPQGRKIMDAASFSNGYLQAGTGMRFG